jgi:hypothetical protein
MVCHPNQPLFDDPCFIKNFWVAGRPVGMQKPGFIIQLAYLCVPYVQLLYMYTSRFILLQIFISISIACIRACNLLQSIAVHVCKLLSAR